MFKSLRQRKTDRQDERQRAERGYEGDEGDVTYQGLPRIREDGSAHPWGSQGGRVPALLLSHTGRLTPTRGLTLNETWVRYFHPFI